MDIRAESPDEGRYNNAHRAFLQAFLSRSVMTVDEIKPVLAAVMSAKSEELYCLISLPHIYLYFLAIRDPLTIQLTSQPH